MRYEVGCCNGGSWIARRQRILRIFGIDLENADALWGWK